MIVPHKQVNGSISAPVDEIVKSFSVGIINVKNMQSNMEKRDPLERVNFIDQQVLQREAEKTFASPLGIQLTVKADRSCR